MVTINTQGSIKITTYYPLTNKQLRNYLHTHSISFLLEDISKLKWHFVNFLMF